MPTAAPSTGRGKHCVAGTERDTTERAAHRERFVVEKDSKRDNKRGNKRKTQREKERERENKKKRSSSTVKKTARRIT